MASLQRGSGGPPPAGAAFGFGTKARFVQRLLHVNLGVSPADVMSYWGTAPGFVQALIADEPDDDDEQQRAPADAKSATKRQAGRPSSAAPNPVVFYLHPETQTLQAVDAVIALLQPSHNDNNNGTGSHGEDMGASMSAGSPQQQQQPLLRSWSWGSATFLRASSAGDAAGLPRGIVVWDPRDASGPVARVAAAASSVPPAPSPIGVGAVDVPFADAPARRTAGPPLMYADLDSISDAIRREADDGSATFRQQPRQTKPPTSTMPTATAASSLTAAAALLVPAPKEVRTVTSVAVAASSGHSTAARTELVERRPSLRSATSADGTDEAASAAVAEARRCARDWISRARSELEAHHATPRHAVQAYLHARFRRRHRTWLQHCADQHLHHERVDASAKQQQARRDSTASLSLATAAGSPMSTTKRGAAGSPAAASARRQRLSPDPISNEAQPLVLPLFARPSDIVTFWAERKEALRACLDAVTPTADSATPLNTTNGSGRKDDVDVDDEVRRDGGVQLPRKDAATMVEDVLLQASRIHPDCTKLLSELSSVRKDLQAAYNKAAHVAKTYSALTNFAAPFDGGKEHLPPSANTQGDGVGPAAAADDPFPLSTALLPKLESALGALPILLHVLALAWRRCAHLSASDIELMLASIVDTTVHIARRHATAGNGAALWRANPLFGVSWESEETSPGEQERSRMSCVYLAAAHRHGEAVFAVSHLEAAYAAAAREVLSSTPSRPWRFEHDGLFADASAARDRFASLRDVFKRLAIGHGIATALSIPGAADFAEPLEHACGVAFDDLLAAGAKPLQAIPLHHLYAFGDARVCLPNPWSSSAVSGVARTTTTKRGGRSGLDGGGDSDSAAWRLLTMMKAPSATSSDIAVADMKSAFEDAEATFAEAFGTFGRAIRAVATGSLRRIERSFSDTLALAALWAKHPCTSELDSVQDAVSDALAGAFTRVSGRIGAMVATFDGEVEGLYRTTTTTRARLHPMTPKSFRNTESSSPFSGEDPEEEDDEPLVNDGLHSTDELSPEALLATCPSVADHIRRTRTFRREIETIMESMKLPGMQHLALPAATALAVTAQRFHAQLKQHEANVVGAWNTAVSQLSLELLELPVLRLHSDDDDTDKAAEESKDDPALHFLYPSVDVALDPTIHRVLTELPRLADELGVPPKGSAAQILAKLSREVVWARGFLHESCVLYRKTVARLGHMERGLLYSLCSSMSDVLNQGATRVLWRGTDIETYATQLNAKVRNFYGISRYVSGNIATMRKIVANWTSLPPAWVFASAGSAASQGRKHAVLDLLTGRNGNDDDGAAAVSGGEDGGVAQFTRQDMLARKAVRKWRSLVSLHVSTVQDLLKQHRRIHRLVLMTRQAAGIPLTSPEWERFLKFTEDVVASGIARALEHCLRGIVSHLDIRTIPTVTSQLVSGNEPVGAAPHGSSTASNNHNHHHGAALAIPASASIPSSSPSVVHVSLFLRPASGSSSPAGGDDDDDLLSSGRASGLGAVTGYRGGAASVLPLREAAFDPDVTGGGGDGGSEAEDSIATVQDRVFRWVTNALSVAEAMKSFLDPDESFFGAASSQIGVLDLQDDALKLTDHALKRLELIRAHYEDFATLWEVDPVLFVEDFCKGRVDGSVLDTLANTGGGGTTGGSPRGITTSRLDRRSPRSTSDSRTQRTDSHKGPLVHKQFGGKSSQRGGAPRRRSRRGSRAGGSDEFGDGGDVTASGLVGPRWVNSWSSMDVFDSTDPEKTRAAELVTEQRDERRARKPTLDAIERRITMLEELPARLVILPSDVNYGWLRVDCAPIKSAAVGLVKQWTRAFGAYLATRVENKLKRLNAFCDACERGILRSPVETDAQLGAVVQRLQHLTSIGGKFDTMFDPMKDTIAVLSRHDFPYPHTLPRDLEAAVNRWRDMRRRATQISDSVSMRQHAALSSLRAQEVRFHEAFEAFVHRLVASGRLPITYDFLAPPSSSKRSVVSSSPSGTPADADINKRKGATTDTVDDSSNKQHHQHVLADGTLAPHIGVLDASSIDGADVARMIVNCGSNAAVAPAPTATKSRRAAGGGGGGAEGSIHPYLLASTRPLLSNSHRALEVLRIVTAEVAQREGALAKIRQQQAVFGSPPTPCKPLAGLKADLVTLRRVWECAAALERYLASWCTTPFSKLDTEDVEATVKNLHATIRRLERASRQFPVTLQLEAALLAVAGTVPLATSLRQPSVKPKHIATLMRQIENDDGDDGAGVGANNNGDEDPPTIGESSSSASASVAPPQLGTFTLDRVLALRLVQHAEAVSTAVDRAAREAQVEKQLNTLRAVWQDRGFDFAPTGVTESGKTMSAVAAAAAADAAFEESQQVSHPSAPNSTSNDTAEVFTIVFDDELMATVEEHQVALQQLGALRHAAEMADELSQYRDRLHSLEGIAGVMTDVQTTWRSLVSVFADSEDVRAQLGDDVARFQRVHARLVALLRSIRLDLSGARAIFDWVAPEHHLRETLVSLQDEFAVCQRALDAFLDLKRQQNPRLHFLSLPDTLELLAIHDVSSLLRLSNHIGKLFPGLTAVDVVGPHQQQQHQHQAPQASGSGGRQHAAVVTFAAPGDEENGTVPPLKTSPAAMEAETIAPSFGSIVAVTGVGGERFALAQPVRCGERVELWLARLTMVLRATVAVRVAEALSSHARLTSAAAGISSGSVNNGNPLHHTATTTQTREAWVDATPSQVALLVDRAAWTSAVVAAFHRLEDGDSRGMIDALGRAETSLAQLVSTMQPPGAATPAAASKATVPRPSSSSAATMTSTAQTKMMNVITASVNCRDILAELVARKAESETSFLWRQQLRAKAAVDRYKLAGGGAADFSSPPPTARPSSSAPGVDPSEESANAALSSVAAASAVAELAAGPTPAAALRAVSVALDIFDVSTPYGWEYVGNPLRLVITPLTNRINVTLTLALHLRLGGAPCGPAGTGKTESTKDLGAHVGRPVFVYNCSDQMTSRTFLTTLRGIAASGAWGCFDEFNRVAVEVLSVFSAQFKTLLDALRDPQRKAFDFAGERCELHHSCGVFVTMNPGYAGRTELPDSLKVLFRQVTVVVPDLQLIAENTLLAAGFAEARSLCRKFIALYRLGSELLSKATHYDWGLRSVKSLLVVASSLRRSEPQLSEAEIIVSAIQAYHEPKLTPVDSPVFTALLGDLFPGVKAAAAVDQRLAEACRSVAPTLGLTPEPGMIRKALQLHGVASVRHSIFLLGPPSSGKSAVWRTAADGLRALGRRVTMRVVCPKTVTSAQLYGYTVAATKEWKDGLLTKSLRELCAASTAAAAAAAAAASHNNGQPSVPPSQPRSRRSSIAMDASTATGLPSMGGGGTPTSAAAAGPGGGVTFTADLEASTTMMSASSVQPGGGGLRSGSRTPRRASLAAIQGGPPALQASPQAREPTSGKPSALSPAALGGIAGSASMSQTGNVLPGSNQQSSWLVLDGDLDTAWIESMNSVMDDNKTLTLASHERIALPPAVRLLFEIDNLLNATPATVSRAGIVYVSDTDIGWAPIVTARYDGRGCQSTLGPLFDRLVPAAERFLRTEVAAGTCLVPVNLPQLVAQLCDLIDAVTAGAVADLSEKDFEAAFCFALTWSFGAILPSTSNAAGDLGGLDPDVFYGGGGGGGGAGNQQQQQQQSQRGAGSGGGGGGSGVADPRMKFDRWLRRERRGVKVPAERTFFDYFYDAHSRSFVPWHAAAHSAARFATAKMGVSLRPGAGGGASSEQKQLADALLFSFAGSSPQDSSSAQTIAAGLHANPWLATMVNAPLSFYPSHHVGALFVASLAIRNKKPFLFVGPGASGKSTLLARLVNGLPIPSAAAATLRFSHGTTSESFQADVEAQLERQGSRSLGPPRGKQRFVLAIEDLNLPSADAFGSQAPLALLQQLADYGHWMELAHWRPRDVHGVSLVATLNPTDSDASGGGAAGRLQAKCRVAGIAAPSRELTSAAVAVWLGGGPFNPGASTSAPSAWATTVSTVLMEVFDAAARIFPRSAVAPHYVFHQGSLVEVARTLNRVLFAATSAAASPVSATKRKQQRSGAGAHQHGAGNLTSTGVACSVAHELLRAIGDRLQTESEVGQLVGVIERVLHTHLPDADVDAAAIESTLFTSFHSGLHTTNRYEPAPNEAVLEAARGALVEFNRTASSTTAVAAGKQQQQPMDLVLFAEAAETIAVISRTLGDATSCSPRGLLLVGQGGSGRRALTRLAASIHGYAVRTPELTPQYDFTAFLEEFKKLATTAAMKSQPTLLLLTEAHVNIDPRVLALLSEFAQCGDWAGLWDDKERASLIRRVSTDLRANGGATVVNAFGGTMAEDSTAEANDRAATAMLRGVLMSHMRIALCSTDSEAMRRWLRQYPGLRQFNHVRVRAWPEVALSRVSQRLLSATAARARAHKSAIAKRRLANAGVADETPDDLSNDDLRLLAAAGLTDKQLESIGQAIVDVFTATDRFIAETTTSSEGSTSSSSASIHRLTPKTFVDAVRCFVRNFERRAQELAATKSRYNSGIRRLEQTSADTVEMQALLVEKRALADEKRVAAEALMLRLETERAAVEAERKRAAADEAECTAIQRQVAHDTAECEAELAKAEPNLQRAATALNTLNKTNLTELKTFKSPPADVQYVLKCVVILLTNGTAVDKSWNAAVKHMSRVDHFLIALRSFNKEGISDACIAQVKPFTRQAGFNGTSIMAKSFAAAGLCDWVVNIVEYHRVYWYVKPKRDKLAQSRQQLEDADATLSASRGVVKQLQQQLDALQAEYQAAEAERADVAAQAKLCEERLAMAHRLVAALADEGVRWADAVKCAAELEPFAVGDALLAMAFEIFAPPFSLGQRRTLLEEHWRGALHRADVKASPDVEEHGVKVFFSDPTTRARWHAHGLPKDEASVVNACVLFHADAVCLVTDPEAQCAPWLSRFCTEQARRDHAAAERDRLDDTASMSMTLHPASPAAEPTAEDFNFTASTLDTTHNSGGGGTATTVARVLSIKLKTRTPAALTNDVIAAITTGSTMLVDVTGEETLPAVLDNLVRRRFTTRGSARHQHQHHQQRWLAISDNAYEVHPKFRLFLLTQTAEPQLRSDVLADVTVVNFSATMEALEEQLLSAATQVELADVEKKLTAAELEVTTLRETLVELEQSLVRRLAQASTTVEELLTPAVVTSTEELKQRALTTNDRISVIEESRSVLAARREVLRPLAHRGALVFFVSRGLPQIVPLYAHSLGWFNQLYATVISRGDAYMAAVDAETASNVAGKKGAATTASASSGIPKPRPAPPATAPSAPARRRRSVATTVDVDANETMEQRVRLLTLALVIALRRGLMASHRLSLTFGVALRVAEDEESLLSEQLAFLLGLPAMMPTSPTSLMLQAPPAPWLTTEQWRQIAVVTELCPGFSRLAPDLATGAKRWEQWQSFDAPEESRLPGGDWRTLGPFATLLLVRILRPDRFRRAATRFVGETLGPAFTSEATSTTAAVPNASAATTGQPQPPQQQQQAASSELNQLIRSMSPATPLLFVLFAGADPVRDLEKAARRFNAPRFTNIALGEGQGPAAIAAIEAATADGGWLVLQNLHLMAQWLPELEDYLERRLPLIANGGGGVGRVAAGMRLFFTAAATADPSRQLPMRLVQRCAKLALETPIGLRANVTRALGSFSSDAIERNSKPSELRCLLFGLAVLHATLLGRHRYGAVGWSGNYAFGDSDLDISRQLLERSLDQSTTFIPWATLRFFVGEIVYGGLVTDTYDRRALTVHVQKAINEESLGAGTEVAEGVVIPAAGNLPQLITAATHLLPEETPGAYGLHASSDYAAMASGAAVLAQNTLSLIGAMNSDAVASMRRQQQQQQQQPEPSTANDAATKAVGGGGGRLLEALEDFLGTLATVDVAALHDSAVDAIDDDVPLSAVFAQEAGRMKHLVLRVAASLDAAAAVLRGRKPANPAVDRLTSAIDRDAVPDEWAAAAYPSLRGARAWIDDLGRRMSTLERSCTELAAGGAPRVLWLGGFFSPSSVLTTILQSYARKHGGVSIDTLAIETEVLKKSSAEVTHGAGKGALYVSGLFLEGAAWDARANALTDPPPRQSAVALPVVALRAVPAEAQQTRGIYWAPVYATRARGSGAFVQVIGLRTNDPQSVWVLRGAAVLLDNTASATAAA